MWHHCGQKPWQCRYLSKVIIGTFLFIQVLYGVVIMFNMNFHPRMLLDSSYFDTPEEIKPRYPNNDTISLQDDNVSYFTRVTDTLYCYTEGTNLQVTKKMLLMRESGEFKCVCRSKYHGKDCGIPDAVWSNIVHTKKLFKKLHRRTNPRRIINGFPLLKEFELLEARVHDLSSAVDVFLVGESNYSAHGDPKPVYVMDKLNQGFLSEFQDQILHVFVDFFPEEAKKNSRLADQYLRILLGQRGVSRIRGLRDDDLFILNDADEVPSREVITFLKLYDGYSEPVSLSYHWNLYGFFWENKDAGFTSKMFNIKHPRPTITSAVCTIKLLREVFNNNPFKIRSFSYSVFQKNHRNYTANNGSSVKAWTIGNTDYPAGWHCSWCYSDPKDIVIKLDAAQAGDLPRWGDYPEKHNHTYLLDLIQNGRWFDGTSNVYLTDPRRADYAPPYLLANKSKFHSILYNSKQLEILEQWKKKRRSTTSVASYTTVHA